MKIPINNLKRHIEPIQTPIKEAIERVMSSGWYILGLELEAFEKEFALYCDVAHSIGVANGTDALEISLRALGVLPRDQVITVANAGMYSTTAILALGAIPIYVDVCPLTMNMDPQALEEIISTSSSKIKAIIVTHLYGQMADMESLTKIAKDYSIPLIEDCAQAHGAILEGRKAGSWGEVGCFSFYPTKNLGAMGDGGAIITNNEKVASLAKSLRQYGWTKKYHSSNGGGRNSRLDEIQAAILRVKLPFLDKWNNRRREIAEKYSEKLKNSRIITPSILDQSYVAHLYIIRLEKRGFLQQKLSEIGIGTDIHYPLPDYAQKSVTNLFTNYYKLFITEKSCQEVLTLPCYPELFDEEIDYICKHILSFN